MKIEDILTRFRKHKFEGSHITILGTRYVVQHCIKCGRMYNISEYQVKHLPRNLKYGCKGEMMKDETKTSS